MKKLAILLLGVVHFSVYAKDKMGVVKGIVKDDMSKPCASATVLLQKTKDSLLVKTDITDANGKFEFSNISDGSYFIIVSSAGFTHYISGSIVVTAGETIELPQITLQITSKELNGVTVKARKPLIEVKADKMILNVENSINATGSNALELLRKSPGVVVDKDDNISVKGKNGVRIYIDGRPSQMDNKDLAALLKSMNSADIEAIEFITNPSAKFDASGNAGIINIKLKKDKKLGLNGNVSTGIMFGITPKNTNSFSLNYRNKKVNYFANYSNGFGIYQDRLDIYRKQADSLYDTKAIEKEKNQNHNFKAGVDFFLNNTHTIGIIITGNLSNGSSFSDSKTPITSLSSQVLGRTLNAQNILPADTKNFNYNVNYKFSDTAGYELNVDVDYGSFRGRKSSFQPNIYSYPSGYIIQTIYKNKTPIDINIIAAKVDYEKPFAKGKLGFGGKFSDVRTRNIFDFWDVINDQDILNIDRSNHFTYKENVNALYVNYNRIYGTKWTIQAGLRIENTKSEGNLISYKPPKPEDNIKRSYTDIFPSASLSYTANENNQFSATYSRRIDRPSYEDLNPFEYKMDELTYRKGNAFLRPQYANSIEITHLYKNKLTTTFGYSHIKDFIAQLTDTTEKIKSYINNKNIANQDIISLNIGSPIQITKWWSSYYNINMNYSIYKASFDDGKKVDVAVFNYNFYGQNTFTIAKGLTAELSGWYTGPNIWGATFKNKPMGGFDIGVQKVILKEKGTLKLSLTDVTYTMQFKGISSNYAGAYIEATGGPESRQFRINFSYRFGNSNVKGTRERKTGIESENKRIKSGGKGSEGN